MLTMTEPIGIVEYEYEAIIDKNGVQTSESRTVINNYNIDDFNNYNLHDALVDRVYMDIYGVDKDRNIMELSINITSKSTTSVKNDNLFLKSPNAIR